LVACPGEVAPEARAINYIEGKGIANRLPEVVCTDLDKGTIGYKIILITFRYQVLPENTLFLHQDYFNVTLRRCAGSRERNASEYTKKEEDLK
jgi:hypothetical protein